MLCFELQFLETGMITITCLHFNVQVFYFNKRRTNNVLTVAKRSLFCYTKINFVKGGKGK